MSLTPDPVQNAIDAWITTHPREVRRILGDPAPARRHNRLVPFNCCPRCGGTMLGDGVGVVRHCENASEDRVAEAEPDANAVLCEDVP